jgi:nicotinamidase-related amidase
LPTEKAWEPFLTDRDRTVLAAAGYGQRMGFGARPAVVVIDATYNFCGDRREPILESIRRWPNSCGEAAWDAVARIAELVAAARKKALPVIYTTGAFRADGWDYGGWKWKYGRAKDEYAPPPSNRRGNDIVDEIAPGPRDIVLPKLKPSAFHGTPLAGHLTLLGADSIVACGGSTSGCVRATVLDAFSDNYRVAVAEDGCFDRSEVSHAINLMDMDAKYADVLPTSEIVSHLSTLPDGLFDLPPG